MNEPNVVTRVGELRDNHDAARHRLKKLGTAARLLTLTLVTVFATALFMLYGKITDMYAPEKFEEPLMREAQRLIPQLEPELRALWEETAPVYSNLAMEKFRTALPAFQEVGQRELDALLADLKSHTEQQVDASLDRIAANLEQRLEGQFPKLATDEGAEQRLQQWAEVLADDMTQVLVHFEARYLEDLGQLEATLDQFRRSEFDEMSQDELIRQFVHLWLAKLDRWVLTGNAGNSLAVLEANRGS